MGNSTHYIPEAMVCMYDDIWNIYRGRLKVIIMSASLHIHQVYLSVFILDGVGHYLVTSSYDNTAEVS